MVAVFYPNLYYMDERVIIGNPVICLSYWGPNFSF